MYNSIDMNIIKIIKIIALTILFIATKAQSLLADEYTILAFGDSLTAGYGLMAEQGFTYQLEYELNQLGHKVTVVNGGVSGDTTSGGLSRLEWVLSSVKNGKPDLIILELGANDALRGITPDITRSNMERMLAILKQAELKTLVAGMMAPPNMGHRFSTEFNRIFPEVSEKFNMPLYPFFLKGVAGNGALNQSDAVHPNSEGIKVIVKNIIPYILKTDIYFEVKIDK
ncbi:Arylesterase precursor [hydrothermal vent metagenome]|uniref:Arylesterase n=1 Tax=hydrothermal vent metagenome TaxID=652676 RepID=A0A3B1BC57_9ZZZZ